MSVEQVMYAMDVESVCTIAQTQPCLLALQHLPIVAMLHNVFFKTENTIRRYNEYCKVGKDADFGRSKEDLRVLEPPFHAIRLWPAFVNTQGGPRRDKESRVLDPEGHPIPRLYAAGELGSIWGYLYQGACNITEALVFGRIAGENAAAEKPSF